MRRRGDHVVDPDEVYADAVVAHFWSLLTAGRCSVTGCIICAVSTSRGES